MKALEEMLWVEGPVIKLGGELTLLITIDNECSGFSSASRISECLKMVIPKSVAEILGIEAGDMICMREADGKLKMHTLKAGILH